SMPGLATRVLGTIYLTRFWQRRMSKRAARSQERRYPDDWVFEFVPGDSSTFTFGINHLECGICKYYKRMGAEKYIPYLCLLDYPLFAMLGVCLERTETLGNGAMRCDFRFSRRKPVAGGWPPDSVKEFRGGGKRT
ncbi:MAG: L-2-amino-thiazoline-4-carboxylic acid hydrolase, partial [Spirochaetes bacterium]|nr:L-2-amino-thiazoline-4-carboxylic acid hydrolase [Spirochaetota bacterium]